MKQTITISDNGSDEEYPNLEDEAYTNKDTPNQQDKDDNYQYEITWVSPDDTPDMEQHMNGRYGPQWFPDLHPERQRNCTKKRVQKNQVYEYTMIQSGL